MDDPDPHSHPPPGNPPFQDGVDYYIENGRWVFTAAFLLKRGYCCRSGCRHCPYSYDPADGDTPPPDPQS